MSEVRKRQKQNPANKGKGSAIASAAASLVAPALGRVAAEPRTRVLVCLLTPAVVVIHGMTGPSRLVKAIGIGGTVTCPPLPHHRTSGSRIRRFGRLVPSIEHGLGVRSLGTPCGFHFSVSIRCGFTAS